MATYRAMIWWAFDSALPRDRVTVNPHFSGDNPGALADAIMTNLAGVTGASTMTYGVKIYDALKPKPNPPLTERQFGSTQQITDALNFRRVLTTGLPPNTNWIVYSKTAGQSYGVSDCWVDDEWDIQRSRGLRGTTRQLAAVP
jgi:hypothetical protein